MNRDWYEQIVRAAVTGRGGTAAEAVVIERQGLAIEALQQTAALRDELIAKLQEQARRDAEQLQILTTLVRLKDQTTLQVLDAAQSLHLLLKGSPCAAFEQARVALQAEAR